MKWKKFFESDNPQIGIFWFNPNTFTLFGVEKGDADLYANDSGTYIYPKLHKTYWQKQHYRAKAKNNTNSIFYNENDYTKIPRGRIFVENNQFIVKVGSWIADIDIEKFTELIEDEFNITDFQFEQDSHWDLGHGWSEEKL